VLLLLLKDRHLRLGLVVDLVQRDEVGDDPLDRQVLLDRFLEQLLGPGVLRRRVEDLLLDRRVDGEEVARLARSPPGPSSPRTA
jgi:hypothetical protein